ncbi:Cytochrome b561 domain-containing protein [Hibiscus syriacus]|uniref:Cytochrome b561 domain-containing protein n=1 Tax=Hibiscus syriacus TaxID=106335 RepID=A0A6A2XFI9_HIBSY|nr:Cytochrome b561 domain-containing protein [Hibiscus syriacus]
MISYISVHGLLLWASMGFLMPVGILTIRMADKEEAGKRIKFLFYLHAIFQILAVLLATVGAVMPKRNFENSFSNHHQRLGLALYVAISMQVIIGFFRPRSGAQGDIVGETCTTLEGNRDDFPRFPRQCKVEALSISFKSAESALNIFNSRANKICSSCQASYFES